jgi:lysophospholipase L1-like esterase
VIVATLGDSITAGSPLWDPDPAVRERIGTALDERSQWQYWAARRHEGVELRNHGVYGERTDEIAARLDAATAGADVLVVQGGINDVAQRRTTEAAAENLRAMLRRGRALGLRVLLADVLAWNAGSPGAAEAIADLNRRIEAVARDEGVPLLPFHDTLADHDRPGRMRVEWTDDGDHPTVDGYRRLGELAFALPD